MIRFHIVDFPHRRLTVGQVLTLADNSGKLRVVVHRCVQQQEAHLTFSVGSRWRATFTLDERPFQCSVAQFCMEVRACGAAAASVALPSIVQHCLGEASYALAAYIAKLPPDGTVFAAMEDMTWTSKGVRVMKPPKGTTTT